MNRLLESELPSLTPREFCMIFQIQGNHSRCFLSDLSEFFYLFFLFFFIFLIFFQYQLIKIISYFFFFLLLLLLLLLLLPILLQVLGIKLKFWISSPQNYYIGLFFNLFFIYEYFKLLLLIDMQMFLVFFKYCIYIRCKLPDGSMQWMDLKKKPIRKYLMDT